MNKITLQQIVNNFDENCVDPGCPVLFIGRIYIYGFEDEVSPELIALVKSWAVAEPGFESTHKADLVDIELAKLQQ